MAYQYTTNEYLEYLDPWYNGPYPVPVNHTVCVDSSGWSPTQTFTLPATPAPTNPLVSEILSPLIIAVIAVAAAVSITLLFYRKHRKK